MVTQLVPQTDTEAEIIYPESDGRPMADNTIQFRWITVIYYNLAWLFAQDDNVFVAGDLLWYPVKGNNKLRQAPDVMVAFGVEKKDRGSYQQWKENNIAPQVVFEILSPGNTLKEMSRKLLFYQRYGVEEYYVYDPQKNSLTGWVRSEEWLDTIDEINGWVSPRLGIRFEISSDTLLLYRPDGKPFADYLEVQQQLDAAENRAAQAEAQLEQERQAKEQERQAKEQERQAKEMAIERANRLEQLLREAGISLDENS
jgi:Uma2 family endonuclease